MKKTINLFMILAITFWASCAGSGDTKSDENDTIIDQTDNLDEAVTAIRKAIDKPLESVDIEFFTAEFANNEREVLRFGDSEVIIEPDIFVDENKQPVKGAVTIKYRELKTAAQIIASGITMKYDSAGVTYNFTTAGMFEVRGYADDKAVYIREGKSIEVNMASPIDGNFNYYTLDEESGWQYVSTIESTPAEEFNYQDEKFPTEETNLSTGKAVKMPRRPIKADPSNDIVLQIRPDLSAFDDITFFKNAIWKYAGDKNKNEIASVFQKKWQKQTLVQNENSSNIFTLQLKNKTEAVDMEVSPALTGKAFTMAMAEFNKKKAEYENTQKRLVASKRLRKKAELERPSENVVYSATIRKFGISNCDYFYRIKDKVQVLADIRNNNNLRPIAVYQIIGEQKNTIIRNDIITNPNIYYLPSEKVAYLIVFENNYVGVVDYNTISGFQENKIMEENKIVMQPKLILAPNAKKLEEIMAQI